MILQVTNTSGQILVFSEDKLLPFISDPRFIPNQTVNFPAGFRMTSSQLRMWNSEGYIEMRVTGGSLAVQPGVATPGLLAENVTVLPNDNPYIQDTNVQSFLDNVEDILSQGGGGGGGTRWKVEEITLTPAQISNKYIILSLTPINSNITLSVRNGPPQSYIDDFIVSGDNLSWSGRGLDGALSAGDELIIGYEYS